LRKGIIKGDNIETLLLKHFTNLTKIQLFIILPFYYRMKIWQRPIGGHVQTTFIISISPANQNTPYKQLGEFSTFWTW